MKRTLLSAAIILIFTAAGGAAYEASADTGPAPAGIGQPAGPPGQWNGPDRGPWGGPGGPGRAWGPGGWQNRGPGGFGKDDKFSLFAPVPNKNLSAADVKVIASALLLEHGNHEWSVADIANGSDKMIDFSYVSQHGDVIATFAIDPASGKIKRLS